VARGHNEKGRHEVRRAWSPNLRVMREAGSAALTCECIVWRGSKRRCARSDRRSLRGVSSGFARITASHSTVANRRGRACNPRVRGRSSRAADDLTRTCWAGRVVTQWVGIRSFARFVGVLLIGALFVLGQPAQPARGRARASRPGIPRPQDFVGCARLFHAQWYGQSGYPRLPRARSTARSRYYNSGSSVG